MSWSNEVVLEFLELYRVEQHLWDPKHPLHRNRTEVADAWTRIQIALSIDCTVSDLKKKKESLMTSFRMHLNKKKTQESYQTNWFAYTLMESFLGGKYECDSTNQLDPEFFGSSSSYLQPTPPGPEQKLDRNALARQRQQPPCQHAQTSKFKPPEASPDILFMKKQIDEAVTCLKRATALNKDQDEYDLYGQLLAKKMRKLDERQRDLAMHEIDNIMFHAKMKSDSQPPQPCRSYSTSPVQRKINSPVFISIGQPNQSSYEQSAIHYEDHSGIHPPG